MPASVAELATPKILYALRFIVVLCILNYECEYSQKYNHFRLKIYNVFFVFLSLNSPLSIAMSKAFSKETDSNDDDDIEDGITPIPAGSKNYITPGGHQRLKDELKYLLDRERPAVTSAVSWAAKNGDRSENADYQYGKKRLREIDKRLRFLTKRLDNAEVVDPTTPRDDDTREKVFFGATVTYANQHGDEKTITIVGIDELNLARHYITWVSPLARALMKAEVGDTVILLAPGGREALDVIEVRYEAVITEPFVPQAPISLNAK
jgi:transcription elongation factor GreB